MRPVWSEPPLFDDWYSPSSCLTFKNSKAYEEDQVVNSEEGAPDCGDYHLYHRRNSRHTGLRVLRTGGGDYARDCHDRVSEDGDPGSPRPVRHQEDQSLLRCPCRPKHGQAAPRSEWSAPESGHAIPRSESYPPDPGQTIPRSEYCLRESGQTVPKSEYRAPDSGHVIPRSE